MIQEAPDSIERVFSFIVKIIIKNLIFYSHCIAYRNFTTLCAFSMGQKKRAHHFARAIFCQVPLIRLARSTRYILWRNENSAFTLSAYTHRRRNAGKTGGLRENSSCKIRELIIRLSLTYMRVYGRACHLLTGEYMNVG